MVSESLHEYYQEKSHFLGSIEDFASFVTPYALLPIADRLWEIYSDDEDFANGVLTIVHQIPYEETLPVKYPIETIVENKGDCDLFSCIAGSIMKAGGLDVVLLYYESEAHMNVGVNLSHVPNDTRGEPRYVTYRDIRYYVAECTGDSWTDGWRVGEWPDNLNNASPTVINLENCEEWAPGQVSASYETLKSSTITLTISPQYVIQGSTAMLSGQLSPSLSHQRVTIYAKANDLHLMVLNTVTTGSDGKFTYTWRPDFAGVYYIRVGWSGNNEYAGADSITCHVIVFPVYLIALLGISVAVIALVAILFLTSRSGGQQVEEPLPPTIPQ